MSESSSRRFIVLAAVAVAAIAVLLVLLNPPRGGAPAGSQARPFEGATPALTTTVSAPPPFPAPRASRNVFIGAAAGRDGRTIQEVFTTRKREVLYQALIKYTPVPATWSEIPGLSDVLQAYSRQGKELPQTLFRVDQETEMSAANLGEPMRFITSMRTYMNPLDGRTIAYDMAQTTGGQAQRMVGHVTPHGVSMEIYRGGQLADRQDLELARETFIPVDFDFIHLWYEQPNHAEAKRKKEPIRYSIFVPEAMAQVELVVRPLNDESIPVGNANYHCAHYEVITYSKQSAEGLSAKQEMWFDRLSSRLLKRQDFDASLNPQDAPVSEREPNQDVRVLERMTALPIEAPPLTPRSLTPLLETELYYTVTARDSAIGRVSVRFGDFAKGRNELPYIPRTASVPAYYARADVRIETDESARHEAAVTLYDGNWRPLAYETRGDESAGIKLAYDILAQCEGGRLTVHAMREALLELKRGGLGSAARAGAEAGLRDAHDNDALWHDPLRRVPVEDDEARDAEEGETPRLIDQSWSRKFPENVFLSDYNRVEHLLLLARGFPLPNVPAPAPGDTTAPIPTVAQRAALCLVRQNRAGVLLFEIRPEIKPKLSERQRRRLKPEELNEPQLYVATSTAALMPARILLAPDGRILQLKLHQGAGDITYTLDDPIMRQRAERERVQRMQEGPRLLRPPWW